MGRPKIIIDRREQRPYEFENSIPGTLPAGDYSIEGAETRFAIERKSFNDWIQTITHSKDRFRKELQKLQSYDYAAVVIEASISDILSKNYKNDINPMALLGKSCAIAIHYSPVHIIFAGDRPHAHALIGELLYLAGIKYGN